MVFHGFILQTYSSALLVFLIQISGETKRGSVAPEAGKLGRVTVEGMAKSKKHHQKDGGKPKKNIEKSMCIYIIYIYIYDGICLLIASIN